MLLKILTPRVLAVAIPACLFCLIVSAKWATFDRYGSPMPDWDQWDAEAANLLIPWFENDRFTERLLAPHNEHRVILTKLQSLALVLANGQWDSRLEAVTNALLHAALATAFWVFSRRWVALVWQAALFVLAVALFALPVAWQNLLGGFHSQQYWLLALSFVAIVKLPFAEGGNRAWWLGAVCVLLALGSMGSGLLAAAVVTLILVWQWICGRKRLRDIWPTVLVCAAAIALGIMIRVEVPYHEHMKVKTAHDFVFSILRSLEWPLRDRDWAGAILWLPWALVAGRALTGMTPGFRRDPLISETRPTWAPADQRDVLTIAALGGWVLIQIAATAYARGAGADYPASRYMDTLAFGALVNGLALAWLSSVKRTRPLRRWFHRVLAMVWIVMLSTGLWEIVGRNFSHELPDAKKYYAKAEANMRRYLATNDPKHLANPDIPFPSAEGLIERLSHKSLRALMPVPIRAPLELQPAETSPAFQENDARRANPERPPRAGLSPATAPLDSAKTWGSFAVDNAATGTWKSRPLTPGGLGWLKFEIAGDLAKPDSGTALSLLDAQSGAPLAKIEPSKTPGDTWRAAYVRTPSVPYVVAAADTSAASWLAFSPPVEMGAGSYWAWQATKHGLVLVYISLVASVLCCLAAWLASRSTRPPI